MGLRGAERTIPRGAGRWVPPECRASGPPRGVGLHVPGVEGVRFPRGGGHRVPPGCRAPCPQGARHQVPPGCKAPGPQGGDLRVPRGGGCQVLGVQGAGSPWGVGLQVPPGCRAPGPRGTGRQVPPGCRAPGPRGGDLQVPRVEGTRSPGWRASGPWGAGRRVPRVRGARPRQPQAVGADLLGSGCRGPGGHHAVPHTPPPRSQRWRTKGRAPHCPCRVPPPCTLATQVGMCGKTLGSPFPLFPKCRTGGSGPESSSLSPPGLAGSPQRGSFPK